MAKSVYPGSRRNPAKPKANLRPRAGKKQVEMPYHHGNLRAHLMDAAGAIIRESGPQSLSLRDAARRAGVSHTAPYRHFDSKAALIAVLAVEGFAALTATLRTARQEAGPSPLNQLGATGVAYVKYAAHHPAQFRVMFGPRELHDDDPSVRTAGHAAFEEMSSCVAAARDAALIPESVDVQLIAQTGWALVHGLATLILDGGIDAPDDSAIERIVTSSQRLLFSGADG